MGSELPGGQRKKRKKIHNSEDRSTNKIYASGDISALGNSRSVADSTIKPGQMDAAVLKGNATPTQKADDKAADKYYANGGSNRKRVTAKGLKAQKEALKALRQSGQPKPSPDTHSLTVTARDKVAAVCEMAAARVEQGVEGVVIFIPAGNTDLLKRTRAHLELMVTREKLTEGEYRDIRLSYLATEAKAAPPVPTETKAVAAPPTVDPLDFLNSDEGDEVIDTSPFPVVFEQVGPNLRAGEIAEGVKAPEAVEDDDEGDDFLSPVSSTSPLIAETSERIPLPADIVTRLPNGPGLVDTHDGEDLADRNPTDTPVKVVDTEPVSVRGNASNTIVIDEQQQMTPEHVAAVEEVPKSETDDGDELRSEYDLKTLKRVPEEKPTRKPGKRSGRGS